MGRQDEGDQRMEHTGMKHQNARLYDHLRTGRRVTALSAWQVLGIARLSARVYDLRSPAIGANVRSQWREVTNRWGEMCRVKEYFMDGELKQGELL